MNLVDVLSDIAALHKAKAAIVENGKTIAYHELWDRIEKLSAAFHAIGIRENHRVVLILPNSFEFIYCFFALLKINAVITPLSPDSTPYELKGIFNNLNPHAIITMAVSIHKVNRDYPELLQNMLLITQDRLTESSRAKNCFELHSLYEQASTRTIGKNTTKYDQIATINYTYRGFGYPLGAVLSHDNYLQAALIYIKRTELANQHRVLLVLPSYHVFALMGGIIAPLLAGATVIIGKSFIISHIFEIIKNYQITMLLAVPTLYRLLLNYSRDPSAMHSVRCCITGGDLMLADMHEELRAKFSTEVLQGYGLTECLPVTCNPLRKNKVGSLGPTGRQDVKIKIVNDSGDELGPGGIGEILINSPTVMRGYYRLDEITRTVIKDGWFCTGDYGYLDVDDYLYFSGRKKIVEKVGGKLVDLKEVRDVLLSHPCIEEAFLHSKEDQLWGHILEAEIISTANRELIEAETKMLCSRRLSSYKIPKVIRCLERVEVS